jgi:hypothetical protein
MATKPNSPKRPLTGKTADFSSMPEFARAIRGLARVPKAELDEALAKERQAKKRRQPK